MSMPHVFPPVRWLAGHSVCLSGVRQVLECSGHGGADWDQHEETKSSCPNRRGQTGWGTVDSESLSRIGMF